MNMSNINQDNIALVWEEIKGEIDDIFKLKMMKAQRYMALYTQVYNYCTYVDSQVRRSTSSGHEEGGKLVGLELYKKLREYLKHHVQSIKAKGDSLKSEELLSYFQKAWTDFRFSAVVLNGACSYLNKNWVKREYEEGRKNVVIIYSMALTMWKEYLLRPFSADLISAILSEIDKERRGESISTIRLRKIVECLVELGIPGEPNFHVSPTNDGLLGTPPPPPQTPTSSSSSNRDWRPQHSASFYGTHASANPNSMNSESRLDLTTYQNYVEQPFLQETEKFYMLESRQFVQVHHVTDYLKKIEARMNEERTRVKNYLHISTEPKLIHSCEQYLIGDHIEKLTAEFCNLLNEHREEDIWRMYQLVGRFPDGMKELVPMMEKHVREKGLEAIKSIANTAVTDPKLYVDTIMDIQRKYYNLVASACNSDPAFHQALDKGCEHFINYNAITEIPKNKRKTPELLAKYIDLALKKCPKSGSVEDLDEVLQRVMDVFKYVEEKDVFHNFYRKFMARRLVANQSVSEDLESAMISKLKESQGLEYTYKLQRLFHDVSYSRELKTRFVSYLQNLQHSLQDETGSLASGAKLTDSTPGGGMPQLRGIDFSVTVMTSNAWPFPTMPSFSIPVELEHCYMQFAEFYATVHNGRKLSWCYHHSRGELSTNFLKEKYILQVSTYQMAVLMLFNDNLQYSVENIQLQTGIEPGLLSQVLQTLIKVRILHVASTGISDPLLKRQPSEQQHESEPMSVINASEDYREPMQTDKAEDARELGMALDTVLTLALDYKHKRLRVNLNTQLKSEVKHEVESTNAQVDDNRKYIIQACIVRILKARKTIKHQQLVTEVISQLSAKFIPSILLIKQAITLLIDKSYIARNEHERETYEYLA